MFHLSLLNFLDIYIFSYTLDDCAGMFKCNNGRCIQNDSVCNGEDDCKDLTDEHQCGMFLFVCVQNIIM